MLSGVAGILIDTRDLHQKEVLSRKSCYTRFRGRDALRYAVRLKQGDELLRVVDGRLRIVGSSRRSLGVDTTGKVRENFLRQKDGLHQGLTDMLR